VRTDEGNDFDIGRVAQNLMLAAASRGVGSCPITLHDTARAREVLGIPTAAECRYAIALGYPDEEREAVQRADRRAQGFTGRKPIEQIVHREVWGS
jgi:nitroreductase